jgi:hypothetical protein
MILISNTNEINNVKKKIKKKIKKKKKKIKINEFDCEKLKNINYINFYLN